MRLIPLSIVPALLLGACAPKATIVEEADKPQGKPRVAATPPAEDPPLAGPDDGMLGPRGIDRLPSEQEMRPSVDPTGDAPVIARPPVGGGGTGE